MALTSPKMGLRIWDQLADPYDHNQLADNWAKVDQHDHSPGRGVLIPTEGIADQAITQAKLASAVAISPADLSVTTAKIAANAVTADKLGSTLADRLGVNQTGIVRSGAVSIPGAESTAATTYAIGNLTTPDRVQSVVLPANGLIIVAYQAIWQNTIASNGRAAIFLGANQLRIAPSGGGVTNVQQTTTNAATNTDSYLHSTSVGLVSGSGSAGTAEVTTGQIVGDDSLGGGGVVYAFGAAGTYDISVQFKNNAAGTLTVKNRHLWVWTLTPGTS